jgi:hypothetical protein
MAHTFYPKFRLTPPAGPQLSYDLTAYQWVTANIVQDDALFTETEMLDRSTEQTRYGWRRTAVLNFDFPTPSSNETEIAESILSKAMDDEWLIELSMDNGTTYREVVLSSFSRTQMADKNIGVNLSTVWTVKDMMTSLTKIGSGSW